ncbi:MAG: (2Fe-2S)-binding protein [Rhodospirillales bacterium 69-11]|nr:MAG: (2Fe-2S)-binding protein [Rhodospirillales bacterium 69-11]
MQNKSAQAPGTARCPGVTWDDLIAAESRPVPDFLAEDTYEYRGSEPLDASRYTSPEFFKAEVEKIWPNVWQLAAREEDMSEPGDVVVYENVGRSYLVTRQEDGSIRAFHNVCLHRGRKLRAESGPAEIFHCPYHGFAWNLDGTVNNIPCRWDFSHLKDTEVKLPEVETGRWGGYIFVRENSGGPTLEEYINPLPKHFQRWPHEKRTATVWVAKVIHANWKAVMEAFMEAWHAYTTHPQIAPYVSDANSRYNIYGDHVNVGFNAQGAMSPLIDPEGKSEQWVADQYLASSRRLEGKERVIVPEGAKARAVLGQLARDAYPEVCGGNADHATDAEMLDSLFYSVFPNWGPWGGFMPALDYRFRPWPDQDHTLMEVRILSPVPDGKPIPRSVPMSFLTDDQTWASSPEIGPMLGHVLDQDVANVEQVHAGLKVSKTGKVQLGDYMEIRIRQFHQTADKYMSR